MLQAIGEHIQGWIAGVIIALVSATFVFFGLEYYISRSGDQQNVVATVNGSKIYAKELNIATENFQREYSSQPGAELNQDVQDQLRNFALQQLILRQVLLQTADRAGFNVSQEQVQQAVMGMKEFQEDGRFSPSRFERMLANNNLTPQGFLQNLRTSFMLEQLESGIQNTGFATQSEAAQIYSLLDQKRSFGYFQLPSAPYISGVRPTDEQINAFYEKNKEQFRTPDQVKVAYLLLSPDSLQRQINVTPADLQQYYQENSSQFSGKPFDQVKNEIEQRLVQQQLSQTLAAKSEKLTDLTYTNPSSLENASKTLGLSVQTSPLMTRRGIQGDPLFSDPKVLTAVFSDEVLKQGNNSEPIELKDGGYVVVRIAERQASQIQNLAAVKSQIVEDLQKEQGQKQIGLQAFEIQHGLETGINPDNLSGKYKISWQVKKDISRRDKNIPDPILEAAFSLAPAAANKKSVTSILLPNGDYAIIQLMSVQNADYQQLPSAQQQQLMSELAARWGQIDYQLFAASLMNQAKVKQGTK